MIGSVFRSANNCSMPDPVPTVKTKINYWCGEEEKTAMKNNLAYTIEAFPQTVPKEFKASIEVFVGLLDQKVERSEAESFMTDYYRWRSQGMTSK